MKRIIVSDATLKAINEQAVTLTFREKLAIAQCLDSMGVNAIELPALIESKEEEVIYRTIAQTIKNATVKIPVGANEDIIETAISCVKGAQKVCLQVVMPVSTALMEYIYHLKAPAMQEKIVSLVKKAREFNDNVEFVAVDAFRAEQGFVVSCAKSAFEAGATCVTLSDDAGDAFPEDYTKLVVEVKNACDAKVFVKPSNKLSLSASCALCAIQAGADGVVASVCGNYLCPSVFAEIIRAKKYVLEADCEINVTNVNTIAQTINGIACDQVQDVQQNTFTGNIDANSSMSDVANVINQLGYELSDSDIGKVYEEFKKLSTKKDTIDTKELEAVIASTAMQAPSTYHLVNYVVNSGNIIPATANVTLEKDGEKITGVSTGDGPIDAAFHAIEQVIGHHYELDDFQVHAVTKGRGAVGSSLIRLRADGKLYPGNGVSTDIVGACIRAYINALNKIVYEGDQ